MGPQARRGQMGFQAQRGLNKRLKTSVNIDSMVSLASL